MAKTLTDIGIQKIGQRFVDSVDHAAFTLNGQPKTVQPFRKIVSGSDARVYVYFDDTVIGDVSNVELIDTDGECWRSGLHQDTGQGALCSLQIQHQGNGGRKQR